MEPRSKDLILSSGGVDSVVLQYLIPADVLHFDYGQLSAQKTVPYLQYHCAQLGKQLFVESPGVFPFLAAAQPSHQLGYKPFLPLTLQDYSNEFGVELRATQNGWLEGRGILFLLQACIFASARGYERVLVAFQSERYTDTPVREGDTGWGAVDAINSITESFFRKRVFVHPEFLARKLTKSGIVNLGISAGTDFSRTYSCEFYPRCGECSQCLTTAKGFAAHNLKVEFA